MNSSHKRREYLRLGDMGTSRSIGLCGEARPGGVGVRLEKELFLKSELENSLWKKKKKKKKMIVSGHKSLMFCSFS